MNASDFAGYTVTDMRGICRNKGLKGYSRLNRAELIQFLIDAWNTQNDVEIGDTVVWHESASGNPVYGVVKARHDFGITIAIPFWENAYNLLFSEYSKVTDVRQTARMMADFHDEALIMQIRNAPKSETVAQIRERVGISHMDYPVPDGRVVTEAHVKICRDRGCVTYVKNSMDMGYCPRCGNVTTSEEQITEEEIMETDPITESAKYVDEITAFLTTRFVKVRQARESLPEDSADFDGIVQIENDLRRAMGEFERTLAYIRTSGDDDNSHTCDLNLREVGLSGCSYGCKIYRCQSCGADREIHSTTYGCRS